MKNSELNVRTIDEGAVDEKSGMNFSEYIAILSGDTSLLEKSKLEKKVAVMESLKNSHFRELTRHKNQLEKLQNNHASTEKTLGKISADATVYKDCLRMTKEGTKANPIQLDGIIGRDSEAIGKHIIQLYQNWKPQVGQHEEKIGNLYGFQLYIRRQQEAYEENGLFEYRYSNSFYAQRESEGIKYTYNNGLPNTDHPKLAARHFLNAIDRVEHLKERYERNLSDLKTELPKIEKLTTKPFTKESELRELKTELANLERQIAIKIQENQLKQHQPNEPDQEQTPVIKLGEHQTNGHAVKESVVAASASERPRSRMRL